MKGLIFLIKSSVNNWVTFRLSTSSAFDDAVNFCFIQLSHVEVKVQYPSKWYPTRLWMVKKHNVTIIKQDCHHNISHVLDGFLNNICSTAIRNAWKKLFHECPHQQVYGSFIDCIHAWLQVDLIHQNANKSYFMLNIYCIPLHILRLCFFKPVNYGKKNPNPNLSAI